MLSRAAAVDGLIGLGSGLAAVGAVHAAVNAALLRRPDGCAAPAPLAERVAILIPARNEELRIGACVASAVGQGDVHVLDDGSSDATAEHAAAAGAMVHQGAPPPTGWLGKPWACAQLAGLTGADVLVFVDADVELAPNAVAAAVGLLRRTGLDVVCPFPRQLAGSPAERLVQPVLQWSWLTLLPLRVAERSDRPSLTAACGQFLVIRRAALARAGGHAAVRHAVLDDLALVRAVKRSGGRGGVVDGTQLATCRMYRGWAELRDGYGKSLWSAFGSDVGALGAIGGLAMLYLLPPLAAARGSAVGTAGYLAGVASRIIAARCTGARAFPDAFAHPVSIALVGYLTLRSRREHRRGRLRWKGRVI